MVYQIDYAYTSNTGKIRANNEDNFWCRGEFLPEENDGMTEILSGSVSEKEHPAFAVFDGMGGECCGETAAYLAARSFGKFYQEERLALGREPEGFWRGACARMNRSICEYGEENRISSMGSTLAGAAFSGGCIHICNLGDSRIYQFQDGVLRQISVDHVLPGSIFGKAPLTQYLGAGEDVYQLEPSLESILCRNGEKYLICSDGVTDMLSDDRICEILALGRNAEETVRILRDKVMECGGRDNLTLILCQMQRKDIRFWEKVKCRLLGSC